jgi:hypothetical protein
VSERNDTWAMQSIAARVCPAARPCNN